MKKMIGLLIILGFIYFGIQIAFQWIDQGHIETYTVETGENIFQVKEILTVNTDEDDNYYLEIMINDNLFDFQIFNNLNMSKRVVTDIYYYDRDYKCVLPIIEGKAVTDILCKQGESYYHYQDLKGKSSSLDLFISSLDQIYDSSRYENHQQEIGKENNVSVYNMLSSHFIAMENYKGIYTINGKNLSKIYNISLFNTDIYNKTISCYVDKYYLVADYSKQTKFNEFKLVDITNNKVTTIKYDYDISLDSYIMGTDDTKAYLFDNDTKKEYEIDVKKETIIEIGNPNVGIKVLVNGNFEVVNAYTVYQNQMIFTPYVTTNEFNGKNYEMVLRVGIEKSGYYYLFEKSGNRYKVYRSNIQNGINKTYLFETDSKELLYMKDNVYYVDGKYLKCYNNQNGNQIILENKELEFNHNIKIGLFTK